MGESSTEQQINELTARLAQLETELDEENAANNPDRVKQLENMVTRITNPERYFQYDYARPLGATLPEKFATADIPKFKSTDNPLHHLRSFQGCMTLKGVDPDLYASVFPMSLESIPLN